MKKPIAVIPMHDPTGMMMPHLETITPVLKRVFTQVFVSVTTITRKTSPESVLRLNRDRFFQVINHETNMSVGEDFLSLYAYAASACDPNQILHLCFIDRVAYALQSNFEAAFIADVSAVKAEQTPLIFARSEAAWQTHPCNYRKLEQIPTTIGEMLFGKTLDFAWCHLVIQAHLLQQTIPLIKRRDLSFFAEFSLALRNEVQMREVDWLSWEDPFIMSYNPEQLKLAKEQSADETRKRLSYVIPILQLLAAANDHE